MKLRKLSEIAPLPPVAVTDQIVGVIGGTTDALFSLIQLHDLVDATSDLDFYVATTGSDSNPGTIGSPFLTIQYAVNVASAFNYLGMFFPTIHVADGTYTTTETIILRFLTAIASGVRGTMTCNNGVVGNVIIDNTASGFPLFQTEANANWNISGGFHGKSANSIFRPDGGTIILSDSMICDDPSNGGLMYLANVQNAASFSSFGNTITIVPTTFAGILQIQGRSGGDLLNGTVVLPTNWVCTNGLYVINGRGVSIVRFNTYLGGPISASAGSLVTQLSQLQTETGLPSDIPDGLFYDATAVIDESTGGTTQGSRFYVVGPSEGPHGNPVPAHFRNLAWQIYKDDTADTGAGIYVAGNDGGLLFLIGEGLPYTISTPLTGDTVASGSPLKTNIINPAGTLATLTITMPDTMPDGYITRVSTTQTITAITWDPGAASMVGAPTTLAAGTSVQFIYNLSGNTWYPG